MVNVLEKEGIDIKTHTTPNSKLAKRQQNNVYGNYCLYCRLWTYICLKGNFLYSFTIFVAFIKLSIKRYQANTTLIKKPVNWFAVQISRLVSIWASYWSDMSSESAHQTVTKIIKNICSIVASFQEYWLVTRVQRMRWADLSLFLIKSSLHSRTLTH